MHAQDTSSTGKKAKLRYTHNDKEKTEDSKAMKNETGGHLSDHRHYDTLAYNTIPHANNFKNGLTFNEPCQWSESWVTIKPTD